MRQISSRQREEPTKGQPDGGADACYRASPGDSAQSPLMSEHPSAPSDFTAQVMARLAAPPPQPDPRALRARARRARAKSLGRVYGGLVVGAAVVIAALAIAAPATLASLVVKLVDAAVITLAGAAYIARATGGFINGVGDLYAVMLALLVPALLILLARRITHRRVRIK
jgi:hypothetical protein